MMWNDSDATQPSDGEDGEWMDMVDTSPHETDDSRVVLQPVLGPSRHAVDASLSNCWPSLIFSAGNTTVEVRLCPMKDEPANLGDSIQHYTTCEARLLLTRGSTETEAGSDGEHAFPINILEVFAGPEENKRDQDHWRALVRRVSRRQCELRLQWKRYPTHHHGDQQWILCNADARDMKSLFGTWLNGIRLVPYAHHTWRAHHGEAPQRYVLTLGTGVQIDCSCSREATTVRVPRVPMTVDAEAQCDPATHAVVVGRNTRASSKSLTQRNAQPSQRAQRNAQPSQRAQQRKPIVVIVDEQEEVIASTLCPPQTNGCTDVPTIPSLATLGHAPTLSLPMEPLTIVTTGTRLTSDERLRCEALGLNVNPSSTHDYVAARYLVVEPPLVRSVKLLCAIPFVEAFLHRAWLDAVLASGRINVAPLRYLYSETYTRRGIEASNGFRIDELLKVPCVQRQGLLRGFHVWVHPSAAPQDEPHNDLKQVILASGGVLSTSLPSATLLILPTLPMAVKDRKLLLQQMFHADAIAITVEDVFRSVLQQSRPSASTVLWMELPQRPIKRNTAQPAATSRRRSLSQSE